VSREGHILGRVNENLLSSWSASVFPILLLLNVGRRHIGPF
jgi:hypothetical protein